MILEKIPRVQTELSKILLGKEDVFLKSLCCFLSQGHLLIEDIAGVGKTTMALFIAKAFGLQFRRIQFTSDLLPADIIGVKIFNPQKNEFETHKGPLFTQLLLADEINRAGPRCQSALLEAMAENQVSIEGETLPLPSPFLVIATQNPFEARGTYPLPESQLDRFRMRIQMGFPAPELEVNMLQLIGKGHEFEIENFFTPTDLIKAQGEVEHVFCHENIAKYVQKLLHKSRENATWSPLSPRAGIALIKVAKAWAYLQNRMMIIPDDIITVAPWVWGHRLKFAKKLSVNDSYQMVNEFRQGIALP